MTPVELQLKTTLLQMTAWETHRIALDPQAYREAAQGVGQLMREHFKLLVHGAHRAASEGFQTACENAYFEEHGRFSDDQCDCARQVQQFASHLVSRARHKARTQPAPGRGDTEPA